MFKIDSIHEIISLLIIITNMHHFAFLNIEKHLPFARAITNALCTTDSMTTAEGVRAFELP